MIKIAFISAVWKRPEVFQHFVRGIKNITQAFPHIEFKTFVAGSEGEASEQMVTKHSNFFYVEVPNEPLAEKHNAALRLSLTHRPDYVICLGSDDILSPSLVQVYLDEINKGAESITLKDFYFYDLTSGKASYWGGYIDHRRGNCAGAGALISARLLDLWRWKIWRTTHNKVLDNSLHDRLSITPHARVSLSLKEKGVYAVDLKSNTNMTPFELWPNTVYIPREEIVNEFSYLALPKGNDISDFAYVHPNVIMGDGNVVLEGAIIREGVVMGDDNVVGPYCIVGEAPEKTGWFDKPAGVSIGSNNRFTKQCTIDSGTERKTVVGNNVLMLKGAHCGHDAVINDNVVLSCNTIVGGWTEVGANSNVGLGAAIHQRLQIPEGVMIGMNSTVTKKSVLAPYRKYAGSPVKDIGSNIKVVLD